MIEVHCQCGAVLHLEDQWAGRQGKCPACKQRLAIPMTSQSVAPPPTPTSVSEFAPPTKPAPQAAVPTTPTSSQPSRQPPPRPVTPPIAPQSQVHEGVSPLHQAPAEPMPASTRAMSAAAPTSKASSKWLVIGVSAACGLVFLMLVATAASWALFAKSREVVHVPSVPETNGDVVDVDTTINGETGVETPPTYSPDVEPPTTTIQRVEDDPPPRSNTNVEPVTPPKPTNDDRPVTNDVQTPSSRPRTPTPSGGGLSGGAMAYDDFNCQRIQFQFGVQIPVGANMLEVDGERLPVDAIEEVAASSAPILLLPRGEHALRFRAGEMPVHVTIEGDFRSSYEEMRQFFAVSGDVKDRELLMRGAKAYDVHHTPFLLNFMGAGYAAREQWDAAERKFRRAIRVNATFSPAHLNLAQCYLQKGETERARHEIELADAFNVGNLYDLASPITTMRRELQMSMGPMLASPFAMNDYLGSESLTEEDQRLISVMQAMAKYAVKHEERGKVLNNLAVHFSESGRSETALRYFRESLDAMRFATDDRTRLAQTVLKNMTKACESAKFVEALEYQQMQSDVR